MELNEHAAQARYGRWLLWGTRIGLAFLAIGFLAYILGWPSHVPMEKLPELWKGSSSELLAASGLRPGWHWATLLDRGDMAVLAAIAWLASWSIACLAAVAPLFRRRRETAFVAICLLQVAVLVLAASGILSGTH